MSIFATGMGELYSGFPQKGIILALARSISLIIIPFYSIVYSKYSYMTEVFISLIVFAVITIFSPVYAYKISLKKKTIIVQKSSSKRSIAIFAIFNVLITILSIAIFLSNFSITRSYTGSDPLIVSGGATPPHNISSDSLIDKGDINLSGGGTPPHNLSSALLIDKWDILVLKKLNNDSFKRGEMILLKGDESRFARIIGLYEENIVYKNGRFSIDGSELFQSIFTEFEMKKLSLTDYDVISESDGIIKYPVIQKKDNFTYKYTLKNDEYLAAPDNRDLASEFIIVKDEDIYGRVEGILFSPMRFKFLIKPFLIYEN
jgi:hypothetical protein